MVSKKLRDAVKLDPRRDYEIAHAAGLHPSMLSKLVCGIDRPKPGDPRVLAIAQVVGVDEEECFEEEREHAGAA